MASFPCPYCGHAVARGDDEVALELCPSCAGGLDIAYRYRLVARRGTISGGELYEALDGGFSEKVAVLFVADQDDAEAVARFNTGNRLFAELGGGRGLVRVLELSSRSDRRAYVVMEWIGEGTLESRVAKRGPLDGPTLLETIGDLVNGLSKAHRSMPSIVHNHIHPGKIGFLSEDEIVLFGFEWAEQVFEQDSNLADTFLSDDEDRESKRASDLRRLGQSLAYAATGEWLAELTPAQQRARVRSSVQGPVATFLDRMLSAGSGGYQTAVDAVLDFDRLLRGELGTWRARALPNQQNGDDTTFASEWDDELDFYDEEDDEAVALAPGDYELAEDALVASFGVGRSPPSRPPSVGQRMQAFDDAAAQANAQAQAQANTAAGAKAGRLIGLIMVVVFGGSMCVAVMAEEFTDDFEQPEEVYRPEIPNIEPIPVPERIEPPPLPAPAPSPAAVGPPTQLDSIFRYEGEVNGPENLAGLEIGDPCTVWIEPNDGDLNCRWYIDCGRPARRVYGGGDAGYSTCEINEDGYPIRAADEEDEVYDGAFIAELDGTAPMLMVMDRWLLTPTRAAIRITKAGYRHPGPVPDVEQAARTPREAIQARIDADDWPTYPAVAAEEEDEQDGELPERLSVADIRPVLSAASSGFDRCDLPPGAMATLEITIGGDGRVDRVSVTPDHGSQIERCLIRNARRLRFPSFSGEPMTINWKTQG